MADDTTVVEGTGTADAEAAAAAAKLAADTAAAEKVIADKAVEAYKAALPKPPDKYELALPEKSRLQATALEKTTAFAKANGLTQEQAAAMLGVLNGEAESSITAYTKDWEPGGKAYASRKAEWEAIAQKDPEIGGVQWPATVEYAKRGLHTHASPALKELLEKDALASHPEVIRHFAMLGKMSAEGKIRPMGSSTPAKKTAGQVLFDHPTSQVGAGAA